MNRVNVSLENCYGINKLIKDFDFSQKKIKNIYAPNGFMKSSFAKVFIDLSNNRTPKDEIYPHRTPICNIKDESGNELISDNIFVIESYKEDYKSKKISTLLVNERLKEEYDEIYTNLENLKKTLISSLYSVSGISRQRLENELLSSQINSGQSFFQVFEYAKTEIEAMEESQFEGIKYDVIFNDKVKKFLETRGIQENLQNYIEKYNSLIEQSQYLQPNFTHNNVATISSSLSKNGFFSVQNKINLKKNDGSYQEILSENELSSLIEEEKQAILTNPELQTIFQKIDDALEKNAELRNFRKLLENNQDILLKLNNPQLLKYDLWMAYFKKCEREIFDLLDYYTESKTRLLEIIDEAKNQETDWQNVVDKFNQKFNVPFKLIVENKADVILNEDTPPNIKFIYTDRGEEQTIDEQKLKENILSNGEKRALYILNLIFEIEVRKKDGNDTLVIIDDIADSFDYKNKYAIIEYLKEILEEDIFYMIVMTHNFDFFRTIASRLDIKREDCFMTLKNDSEIKLIPAGYLENVFNYWKNHINTNQTILIASIPFVRNLVEYIQGKSSTNYSTLTSLLHIKSNTNSITLNDLQNIFQGILSSQTFNFGNSNYVLDLIFNEAYSVSTVDENNNLENKITLSIAIRLKAEQFMIDKINNPTFVNSITKVQTFELFNKYQELYPQETDNLKVLGQVNLMTPENIHLNSFMYEPILDMSDRHLITLYNDVKNLNNNL
ncbi:hypothetical protein [Arcobacter sp.]|uniref:hypothetical protein n=1 Tax=Arcobacter sp. TaxID=1872629 RepID=UPI003D0F75FE